MCASLGRPRHPGHTTRAGTRETPRKRPGSRRARKPAARSLVDGTATLQRGGLRVHVPSHDRRQPYGRHGPPVTRADPLTDARVDDTPPDGTTPAIVPDAATDPL